MIKTPEFMKLTCARCASSWGPILVRSSSSGTVTAAVLAGLVDPLTGFVTGSEAAILRFPELPLRLLPAALLLLRFLEPEVVDEVDVVWLTLLLTLLTLLGRCEQLLLDDDRSRLRLGSGIEVTPSGLELDRLKMFFKKINSFVDSRIQNIVWNMTHRKHL